MVNLQSAVYTILNEIDECNYDFKTKNPIKVMITSSKDKIIGMNYHLADDIHKQLEILGMESFYNSILVCTMNI